MNQEINQERERKIIAEIASQEAGWQFGIQNFSAGSGTWLPRQAWIDQLKRDITFAEKIISRRSREDADGLPTIERLEICIEAMQRIIEAENSPEAIFEAMKDELNHLSLRFAEEGEEGSFLWFFQNGQEARVMHLELSAREAESLQF